MKRIVFKYRDKYTNGEWRTQECQMETVRECIEMYGLGEDCEYEIVSVEEIR